MSTLSPRSLLHLTVDTVARNYRQLCEERKDLDIGSDHFLLVFKNDCFLPTNIGELLLQRFYLHQDDNFPADFLTLFTDPSRCPLKRFFIGNVNHIKCLHDMHDVSHTFFQNILKMIITGQNLLELDLGSLFDSELLETDFSTSNSVTTLKRLTMVCDEQNESSSKWSLPLPAIACVNFVTNFTNLKHLCLNNCANVSDNGVAILASKMNHLESLDLSSTSVSMTHVFDKLTTKLKVLIIHNTPLVYSDVTDLLQFSNLLHLDISRNASGNSNNTELCQFLNSGKSLQFLKSLDISGAGTFDGKALQGFLDNHKKLCFLGLLGTHCLLSNAALDNLKVTGEESLKQVLACLSQYRNRPLYLTKALKKMFTFSDLDNLKENVELRKKIIETLLDLMRKYMNKNKEDLQTAASACLFNYVRHDTEKEPNSLHVSILSDMVVVLIELLQKYPKVEQIQRNCLVVLYNKYILSSTKFDAYQLSHLLFKAIMLIPVDNVTGVALDMCAYLSSKISVEETLKLGTRENIKKLLFIISTQVESARVNSLLLCSLRVLWNLTDEAPQTCHMVLDYDGLPLALGALRTFDNKPEVLTKLLGIMNNLAEVATIRPTLTCDDFMSLLRKYLDMNYAIDVSYFSAGTLCNLILDWPDGLRLNCGAQCDFLLSVGSAVNRWKKIETVMVGYRTFKSFLPLLRSPFPDVQLWAIWAVHHVCSQKVERYGQLCRDEGVVDLLQTRAASGNRSDVRDLAVQALDAILEH